jgi:hypothetical protein
MIASHAKFVDTVAVACGHPSLTRTEGEKQIAGEEWDELTRARSFEQPAPDCHEQEIRFVAITSE